MTVNNLDIRKLVNTPWQQVATIASQQVAV